MWRVAHAAFCEAVGAWEKGACFDNVYCQKIGNIFYFIFPCLSFLTLFSESRSLGVVAAVRGSVLVEDQTIDILIQEEETKYDLEKDEYQVETNGIIPPLQHYI